MTSTGSGNFVIAGVTIESTAGNYQACAAHGNLGGTAFRCFTYPDSSSNAVRFEAQSPVTLAFLSGDVALASKPTWADANMEGVVDASVYITPASASASGVVSTSAQTFAGDKTFSGSVAIDTNTLSVVASSHKVGIGVTSPAAPSSKLEVAGSAGANHIAVIRNDSAQAAGSVNFYGSDYANGFQVGTNLLVGPGFEINQRTGNAPVSVFYIAPNGQVNIPNLAGGGSRAVNADAGGWISAASDSSLKSEVVGAEIPGLSAIMRIQPKAYKWLADIERRGDEASVEIGFFADQVAPIIPSAAPKCQDDLYGFYDRSVTAALVKAVQEQQEQIEQLKAEIAALKG